MSETQTEDTESLECAVSDCEKPALAEVYPTHGQTDHSALRCRKCLLYDLNRHWFREWADKIAHMYSQETNHSEDEHD